MAGMLTLERDLPNGGFAPAMRKEQKQPPRSYFDDPGPLSVA
jgi:hypothetical protein